MPSVLVTIDEHILKELEKIAHKRGTKVATLIRVVIIPEWLAEDKKKSK